ncbi:hypothetical protein B0H14DRAFT_141307 [Mycena olivaceomarginata]|nr:hypothetical protein B0H14DRAFT_141307 [Mycena olivaceomarginata]
MPSPSPQGPRDRNTSNICTTSTTPGEPEEQNTTVDGMLRSETAMHVSMAGGSGGAGGQATGNGVGGAGGNGEGPTLINYLVVHKATFNFGPLGPSPRIFRDPLPRSVPPDTSPPENGEDNAPSSFQSPGLVLLTIATLGSAFRLHLHVISPV